MIRQIYYTVKPEFYEDNINLGPTGNVYVHLYEVTQFKTVIRTDTVLFQLKESIEKGLLEHFEDEIQDGDTYKFEEL